MTEAIAALEHRRAADAPEPETFFIGDDENTQARSEEIYFRVSWAVANGGVGSRAVLCFACNLQFSGVDLIRNTLPF